MHKKVKDYLFSLQFLAALNSLGFLSPELRSSPFMSFPYKLNKRHCMATSFSPWEMSDTTDPDDCCWQHTQTDMPRLGRGLKNWPAVRILTQGPIPRNGKHCFQRLPFLNAKSKFNLALPLRDNKEGLNFGV